MKSFAEINDTNEVIRVLVISDSDAPDEETGIAFCKELYTGTWLETSYEIRKNKASPGNIWDPVREAFLLPKPFPSWTLDETTCRWKAPISYSGSSDRYYWDEENTQWVSP